MEHQHTCIVCGDNCGDNIYPVVGADSSTLTLADWCCYRCYQSRLDQIRDYHNWADVIVMDGTLDDPILLRRLAGESTKCGWRQVTKEQIAAALEGENHEE